MPKSHKGRKPGKARTIKGLANLKPLKKAIQNAKRQNQPKQALEQGSPAAAALAVNEADLFRLACKNVTPLNPKHLSGAANKLAKVRSGLGEQNLLLQRRLHAMGKTNQTPAQVSDIYASLQIHTDNTSYLRPGQSPSALKALRRAKLPVQSSIDLHGYSVQQAREFLFNYLVACAGQNMKCVRIVHGKGYGSEGGKSKLKLKVRSWLAQLSFVLAYAECPERLGGSGAVLVLLEKQGG